MERVRIIALSAVLIIIASGFAVTSLVSGTKGTVTFQVVTMTRTFPNGSLSTSLSTVWETTTASDCPVCGERFGPPLDAVAVEELRVNTTSNLVMLFVRDVGLGNATLANATLIGLSTNIGYKGNISVNLPSIRLARGDAVWVATSQLPNLTAGDIVNVKVRTTSGTFAESQFTIGSP